MLRVALLGYGTVGQAVALAVEREHDRLLAAGFSVRCQAALVRDPARTRLGPAIPCRRRASRVIAGADLVIEALGGTEPAHTLVRGVLEAGTPVVTANKTLVAHHGPELRHLARRRGAAFAFDAAVLAGVPFVGALARRPLIASPRAVAGIVNGTSHYVADAIAHGRSSAEALADAVARGFAEPDSRADLGGRDAAEKLAIILQLAGLDVRPRHLPTTGLDVVADADYAAARRLDLVVKPLALASLDPEAAGAWVGPACVTRRHPMAGARGVENVLQLTDEHGHVVSFSGPGAGPLATARTIVDDLVEVASQSHPHAAGVTARPAPALGTPPPGPWFVRIVAGASGLTRSRVAERLASAGLPALHLADADGRIVARTASGAWSDAQRAVAHAASPGTSLVLPILDTPQSF